ncbi:MAG: hypothetical protein EBQ94_01420 [Flavobacteriales bacterium]|nr:hypothetical protein [Flavobacteriales bacterium]
MKNSFWSIIAISTLLLIASCKKKDSSNANEPKLIIKIVTDSTQVRLGNLGNPSSIASGNAGQHPLFNGIAAHYLELAPSGNTALGAGAILYHAAETAIGGSNAIDFSKAIIKNSGETYLEIPLKDIPVGTYDWVRLSVSYQNYDIKFYYGGMPYTGTIASFVGFKSYISSLKVKNQTVNVNANKSQGFWAFESIAGIQTGQGAATTVPNPLFATSPIPAGSCVVTGQFANSFVITGNETSNITVKLSLSTNKSFEWNDANGNGKFDVDAGSVENVVDMGLRGLIPVIE